MTTDATTAGGAGAGDVGGAKLEDGQWVRVYQKPLTGEDYEGVAMLVRFEAASEGYGTERWLVQFYGEAEIYPRDIRPEHACVATLTAADLEYIADAPWGKLQCDKCGGKCEADRRKLWAMNADGATTNDPCLVSHFLCSRCFSAN